MNLELRLGKGNAGSLDDVRAEFDEAERIRNERMNALKRLAKDNPDVLAKLGLKIGDVLVETVRSYPKPEKVTRWRVLGTELSEFGREVKVVAANIKKDGSAGERRLSEYAHVELESAERQDV